jgi:hypothetical protein
MGSQEPIMDFKTQGELKYIIDGYRTMNSCTKLTERWGHSEHRHDFVTQIAIVIGEVYQPYSHRYDHIIGELLGTVICACITSVANFSLVCYSTNDDGLLSSSKVPRLFEGASFLKTVAWVMGKTTHPFLPEELDSLHKGRHDHTGSCLPYGSPIVMLIEDWHGNPHKGMYAVMKKEASRRNPKQEHRNNSSSDQAAILSPPHRTQRSTDQLTPTSRNSSIALTAQQISDAAKAKQVISEISFTQSPQSLHSSPLSLNVSQITPIPENQPVTTTADPDAIPPIPSVWDTTSVLGKPRKPSLAFPAYKPLAGKTHLHGYWKGNGNWVSYTPPIE